MADMKASDQAQVLDLYRGFAGGSIDRREFMRSATALGIASAAASALGVLSAAPSEAAVQEAAKAAASTTPLDLAEWSFFWLGVQRAKLAKGTVVNGEQMYVESFVPAQVTHPFSMVLVHGGGGQGLDWMTTPDGRPGWAHLLVMQGYRVYVVDRPGHGRSPFHPDLHGPFGARPGTYDGMSRQFTAPEKAPMPYGPQAKLHTQWPGASGVAGDPTLDQVAAGQGGAFVPDIARTHAVWAERAGELLDKIGPAVIVTHSAGGPFAWIAANARPNLVVGLLPVEPAGPPFGNLRYGVAASPLAFDPPIADASELKTVEDRGRRWGTIANVSFGVAVGASIAAFVALYVDAFGTQAHADRGLDVLHQFVGARDFAVDAEAERLGRQRQRRQRQGAQAIARLELQGAVEIGEALVAHAQFEGFAGVGAGHQQHRQRSVAGEAEEAAGLEAGQRIAQALGDFGVDLQLQRAVDARARIELVQIQPVFLQHRRRVLAELAKPLHGVHQAEDGTGAHLPDAAEPTLIRRALAETVNSRLIRAWSAGGGARKLPTGSRQARASASHYSRRHPV